MWSTASRAHPITSQVIGSVTEYPAPIWLESALLVDGLGLSMDRAMRQDGRLVGCMVHNERLYFWLNQRTGAPIKAENYEGIRLYWAPDDIKALRERLLQLGYKVSEIVERDYGQTEFFVTDDDGYSHCFGVAINESG